MCAWCLLNPEEGFWSPKTGVAHSWEPPCGCWDLNQILCKGSKCSSPRSHPSSPWFFSFSVFITCTLLLKVFTCARAVCVPVHSHAHTPEADVKCLLPWFSSLLFETNSYTSWPASLRASPVRLPSAVIRDTCYITLIWREKNLNLGLYAWSHASSS